MTKTPNLNLNVPDYRDPRWDVPVNENWNLIDAAVAGKQDSLTFDSAPVDGSNNPITSDGVYNALLNTGSTLSYTGTMLSLKNDNGTALSSVTIKSTPDLDNKTISLNSSDELQTVGVINQNNKSTFIKTWTGTKAQYDAIADKNAYTLYNITDDVDISLAILEALYPVGSIYITTAATCPLSVLIKDSAWVLVSSGRVLQGADSNHAAGSTIEAGLPNITGGFGRTGGALSAYNNFTSTGVFTSDLRSPYGVNNTGANTEQKQYGVSFDASRSSSIYGNSTTVQPPAYIVNIYRRIA